MLGSSIIDIAIGMIFIYLLLSLICSAANEIIERFSKKRAKDLESGLKEMLRSDDLVKSLYEHPLVYSLFPKPYTPGGKNLPSYIPARNFALALMDLAAPSGATGATGGGLQASSPASLANLRAAVAANDKLPKEIKQALLTFAEANLDNPAKVRESIEGWFDSSMDRVSGWYKRRSQLIVLLLGLALAILLNVDSVAVVRALATDKAMRDSLVAAAQEYAKSSTPPSPSPSPSASPSASPKGPRPPSQSPTPGNGANASPSVRPASSPRAAGASPSPSPSPSPSSSPTPACDTPECRVERNLTQIKKLGLPIGWTREPGEPRSLYGVSWPGWAVRIIGWLLTALALSLGAPFWFDMLNKVIVVRGTVKPKEKSPEEQSKD